MPSHSTGCPAPTANQVYYETLREHLGIPVHLADRSEKSLHLSYAKFVAYNGVIKTLNEKWKKDELPWDWKPTCEHIIEIMQSKTFWYDYIQKYFPHVANYLEMVAWLKDQEDGPSDIEVWGVQREKYFFGDLKQYLENDGAGLSEEKQDGIESKDNRKGKEKKKGKEKEQGKGKKKAVESGKASGSGHSKGKGKDTQKK